MIIKFIGIVVTVVIIIGAAFYFHTSQNDKVDEKTTMRFKWTATNSAPRNYPIELVRADLLLADGTPYYVPDRRTIHQGWGMPGSTHFDGDDEKALPVAMVATWFSYIENKFYSVDLEIPEDVFLNLNYRNNETSQHNDGLAFDRIIFGFGPDGIGIIWVSDGKATIEAMTFKGEEKDIDWSNVINNPEISRLDFIDLILEETLRSEGLKAAKENDYNLEIFKRMQHRWPFDLAIDGASHVKFFKYHSFNGETFHFFPNFQPNINREDFGAPKKITMNFTSYDNVPLIADIMFDAEETLNAFETLAEKNEKMTLYFDIDNSSYSIAVSLKTDDKVYKFIKSEVQIYSQ